MNFKEMLKLLKEDVWEEKSQKGSHLQLMHPSKPGEVTIPVHGEITERYP